jgi:hypothetical protein
LHHAISNKLPIEKVFELFYKKRIDYLKIYGLPESKAVLKFLNKYDVQNFNEREFRVIKQFLSIHDIHYISRISHVRLELIRFLIEEPDWIHAGFIKNLEPINSITALRTYIRDTLAMGHQLLINDVEKRLQGCSSVTNIYKLHDQFIEKINEKTFSERQNMVYASSKLEETKTIVQISNYKDLLLEGKAMHHCIVSYHGRIIGEQYFVFKILEPERATLGLHYKNGKLAIDQIRLSYNTQPSDATKEAVYWWLQNA